MSHKELSYAKHVVCVGRYAPTDITGSFARMREVRLWLESEEAGCQGCFGCWFKVEEEDGFHRHVMYVLSDPETAFHTKMRWG